MNLNASVASRGGRMTGLGVGRIRRGSYTSFALVLMREGGCIR